MVGIRYEDDFLIAVDKPSGIDTAPLSSVGEGGSLLEELIAVVPGIACLPGRKDCEPGLLHRLDRDTSGLVLVAKTAFAFEKLCESQDRGLIEKRYAALCCASDSLLPGAKPLRGRIEDGMVRSRFRAYGPKRAKVAPIGVEIEAPGPVYQTEIIDSVESGENTAFELRIFRGFRHQLRAHLAWIGFPILGDPLYAGLPRPRLMLHARALRFPHPQDGRIVEVDCPPPTDFKP
jgi:23S rRNA pseudouridine1911/1915/1917 synthase